MVEICNLTAILFRYEDEMKENPKDKSLLVKVTYYRKKITGLMDKEEQTQKQMETKYKNKAS